MVMIRVPSTESLLATADDALVELIPENDFEVYKCEHDEMETWLFHNQQDKKKPGYQESFSQCTVTAFTEMVLVRPENLQQYVNGQLADLVSNDVLLSQQARQKFSADLQKILITEATYDQFHRFDVNDSMGGSRLKEMFLFRHRKMPDGNVAIIFSYFGAQQFIQTWYFLVANHDPAKVKKWLCYKLFENIMAKMRSLVSRPSSSYRRQLMQ
mmetsp:Transcript_14648/g.25719  ORF Transcript_14648/g.25719 Transcript_14648/m.25719 type:complete len:213 (-) Transcript_14648:9-647(-)